jgi:YD repeat-containing protein
MRKIVLLLWLFISSLYGTSEEYMNCQCYGTHGSWDNNDTEYIGIYFFVQEPYHPEEDLYTCSDNNFRTSERDVVISGGYQTLAYHAYKDTEKCICTLNDTRFPLLDENKTVLFEWQAPVNKEAECSDNNGTVQQKFKKCISEYRCVVDKNCTDQDTKFPNKAENQSVAFTWKSPEDRSSECMAILNSEQQQRKINCKDEFRCLVESCKVEQNEPISSYVSPRDSVFHEDIEPTGADFGLHYSSANTDNTSIAHGWSISSHARLIGNKVTYGSGAMYVVDITFIENNLTVIKSGSNEMLFDTSGQLQTIRDLFTKETKTTFGYDNMGRLVTLTDRYGEVTTIERDADGHVTAIVAPTGQRTLLSIDDNGDLIEVQYEDTSSYVFEYERHLMTKETEPNGNAFLHFFDEHGKVVKVIDAEQGEWLFSSATQSTSGTHAVTRASGDVVTYKNHFLENGILKTEKTLSTGDVVLYENAVDDSSNSTTTCGMKTTNVYKKQNGVLYKDPYTNRRVLESSTVTTPSGLSKVTHYDKTYTTANGKVASIHTTTDTNNKLFTNLRDYAAFKASTTTAESKTSTIDYDIHNQNIQNVKPYGVLETTYTYDAQGRVLESRMGERTTRYSYDSRGNLASTTNPLNQTTTYSYDNRDRLISTTYADGHTSHYGYDANGNMTVLSTHLRRVTIPLATMA